MSLSECFYTVCFTTFNKEHPEGQKQEFLFNDLDLPPTHRRLEAEKIFLELIHDKTVEFDKRNVISMIFHINDNAYVLFEVKEGLNYLKAGALFINTENLTKETNLYKKAGEQIPEWYYDFTNETGRNEFVNREFCQKLGLEMLMV